MMKRLIVGLVGMMALAACGSSGTLVYSLRSPNGSENWIGITCHSEMACRSQAGYECPQGYSKLEEDGKTWTQDISTTPNGRYSMVASSNATVAGNYGGASYHAGEDYHGEWIVKCSGKTRIQIEEERAAICKARGTFDCSDPHNRSNANSSLLQTP